MTTKTHVISEADSVTEIAPTNIFIGTCERCQLPSRVEIDDEQRDHTFMTCLHCDDDVPSVQAQRLYARETTGSCDERCMFAFGKICNCACGGVNHAGDWRWNRHKSTMTADAVEKLIAKRKKTAQRRARREQTKTEEAARPFNEWLDSLDDDIREIINWIMMYENVEDHHMLVDFRLRMMPSPSNPVKYPARPLTDAQLRAAVNMYAKIVRQRERDDEWNKIKTAVPIGRQEIVGEIISRRVDKEETYGYRSVTVDVYKILIHCGTFKIWGNCPDSLIDDVFPINDEPIADTSAKFEQPEVFAAMPKGLKIKMRATLKRSERDESFGFFNRPFKPELLSTSESAPESKPRIETQTETVSAPVKRSASPKSSHADCTHEATKSARAKCRRERSSK